jgi:hypothetical protein
LTQSRLEESIEIKLSFNPENLDEVGPDCTGLPAERLPPKQCGDRVFDRPCRTLPLDRHQDGYHLLSDHVHFHVGQVRHLHPVLFLCIDHGLSQEAPSVAMEESGIEELIPFTFHFDRKFY